MKGTFKRISALLLALILLTQTCVTEAFAAEVVMDGVTLKEEEMYDAEETEEIESKEEPDDAVTDQEAESAEEPVEVCGESDATVVEDEEELLKNETDEADETSEQEMEADEDISDQKTDAALNEEADQEEDIESWIAENIPEDYRELSERPQEWWDSLSEEQLRVARIFAEQIVLDDSFYHEQSLEEVIEILESGEADILTFFDKTIFQNMTLNRLYELKERELDLNELADVIFALWAGEESVYLLEKELLELAVSVSGITVLMPTGVYNPADGDPVSKISTQKTGYTNGKGLPFYELRDTGDGSYVFCLDHGKSCSRTYIYGNMKKITGEAAWLIENYGSKVSGTEGYMVFQMAVWALQDGSTSASVKSDAYAWFVAGGVDETVASMFSNSTEFYFNKAKGKSGTCWVVEGPAGSQRPAKPTPFVTTTYSGGGSGGDGGTESPDIPEPVEPEYDTYSDSISVTYEVEVIKKDRDAGVGLAGATIEIYENGSKVATVTTDQSGTASWSKDRSHSASEEYCSNYDELDEATKAEVDCYTSEEEARDAVEDELSDFADRTYTYGAKEITAPTGYYNNDKDSVITERISGDETAELVFTDQEQLGELTICKEGEVLKNAVITEDGVTFEYQVQPLAGAVYSVYAADTIKTAYGKVVYNKGALVKSGLTTGANGQVKLSKLHLGKYTVVETKPPRGYILNNAQKNVTFTYQGQDVQTVYETVTYANTRQKASVSLLKQDADTKNPLDGAIYGLYADCDIKNVDQKVIVKKGTLIEKITTGENGKATFKADIPIDLQYCVKEITAPYGYYYNPEVYSMDFQYTNMNEAVVQFYHMFENDRTLGAVELVKYDNETESDTTQGDIHELDGAVYGIYAAEDIIHADGKTGVIYQKDELIATGTIGTSPKQNDDGQLLNDDGSRHLKNPGGAIAYMETPGRTLFGDLELGKYYIREITPAEGYLLDETVYSVTFTYKDQMVKVALRDETAADDQNDLTVDDQNDSHTVYSGDYVIKQGVQFIKTSDNNYDTELQPLAGAGFSVYLISELSGVKDGSVVPVNEQWSADDVMTFYDYDFTNESKAKLYKRANETWTAGDRQWLQQITGNYYEVGEMFTDDNGRIETPELPFGTYVIAETTTPENHVCAKPFIVAITQDGGVLYTDATKQTVEKTYAQEDSVRYGDRKTTKEREGRVPQKQRIINNTITETYLRVIKVDEEFVIQPGTYIKPEEIVRGTILKEGTEYRIRCTTVAGSKDSLRALNWKYDDDGYLSFYEPYSKTLFGTKEQPFTTSFLKQNGKILDSYVTLPQKLPIGTYELVEISAPEGYVLNGSEQAVKDTSTGRVHAYEIIDVPKAKVVFTIGNGAVYPDGQMGMNKYALQDSYGNLTVTVLQKNQEQKGIVEITKHGEQLAKIDQDQEFIYEDAPVEGAGFQIIAMEDIYTQELDRSLLEQYQIDREAYLLHKKGDVVATITTDRHGFGYASGLYIGKYKLVETVAGNGFVLNTTETEFEITAQEQTVNFDIYAADYKNERQKLEISVKKTDAETGEALSGAVYGLYAAEDIYTSIEYDDTLSRWIIRDVPELILSKASLVETCTTDESGKAIFAKDLPLGKYVVRELQAPDGYFKTPSEVAIDAAYTDSKGGQDAEKQQHLAEFENYATKAVFQKQDLTNVQPLAGAALEICDLAGKVIDTWISKGSGEDLQYFYENDEGFLETLQDPAKLPDGKTLITKEGHLTTGLHLDKEYILREARTVPGYVTAEEIHFKLIQDKDDKGNLLGSAGVYYWKDEQWIRAAEDILTMLDDVTKLQISKKDLTNGQELPGATLELYDAEDTLLNSWVSSAQPHYIEKLPIGTYRLVEKEAPSGYGYAEDVVFEIKDTGEIQTVEMFDDIQKLAVEKSTISLTQRGDIYKYSIDVLKNNADESMDNVTMTDVLPEKVRLTELWTGSYNQDVQYCVEYQTNKTSQNEWLIWQDELKAEEVYHLQLPASMEEDEYVTAFRFCFGSVGDRFENIIAPVYMVRVEDDAEDVLTNVVELTGNQNGVLYRGRSMTQTRIYSKSVEGYAPSGGKKPMYDITGSWNGAGTSHAGLSGEANSGMPEKISVYGNAGGSATGDAARLCLWISFAVIAAASIAVIRDKRKRI